MASKFNKEWVGKMSLRNTGARNAILSLGKGDLLSSQVVEALFQSLEQNPISAKKIGSSINDAKDAENAGISAMRNMERIDKAMKDIDYTGPNR